MLSSYAADQPPVLVDLLVDADPGLFSIFFRAVQDRAAECLPELRAAVGAALPGPSFEARAAEEAGAHRGQSLPQELERSKDRLASRGAHAAVALIRLGHPEEVWQLLEYSPDPRSRTALINSFSPLGADPAVLAIELARLDEAVPGLGSAAEKNAYLFDKVTSKRRALMLVPRTTRGTREASLRDRLASRHAIIYRDDPDAGIHSGSGADPGTVGRG